MFWIHTKQCQKANSTFMAVPVGTWGDHMSFWYRTGRSFMQDKCLNPKLSFSFFKNISYDPLRNFPAYSFGPSTLC